MIIIIIMYWINICNIENLYDINVIVDKYN